MENEIRMVKGTTDSVSVTIIRDDGSEYTPAETDVVRLGVKYDPHQESYDIIKTGVYDSENGYFVFEFSPSDTAGMIAELYGERYWYDVSLQTASGDFYVVIQAAPFVLLSAVTVREVS